MNTIWITSIPPSLVQHDKRDCTQYGPQFLTTWPLNHFQCTLQPLMSWHHLCSSILTPRRPLCWQFRVLLFISNPGGPIQNITLRTHPSRFHGRCWLFLRYFIYLDQTLRREHLLPSMPIVIHWIHSSLFLGSHCQQGSQHDSISLRVTHPLHSSRWPPRSQSSTSKTVLSD